MLPREHREQIERKILSPYATFADSTKGRLVPEEKCSLRTDFTRDRDRIIHCKSFRRLKHKTQVFLAPEGDHYRTRLTHTLEVSQIARTISRALSLNEDLTEAIAMGHDLGHTPFGHAGERMLDALCKNGFSHNAHSLRVVDVLEKNHNGLNLTYEVRDGILNHSGDGIPSTLEGQVVRQADRIAYINHDIDDAIRAGILTNDDIPKYIRDILGNSHSLRIDTLIRSVVDGSVDYQSIRMTEEIAKPANELRNFMFDRVYFHPVAKVEEEKKVGHIITSLFEHFTQYPETLPDSYKSYMDDDGIEQAVCDYIASMSDQYAISVFEKIFVPQNWNL